MTLPTTINSDYLKTQTGLILSSYKHWFGKDLIEGSSPEAAFEAPFVLTSADATDDPVLNYGNRKALELWEMPWEVFTKTPGRKTAEPMEREARALFLHEVREKGYVTNYEGIRISSSGRLFKIRNVTVWNLVGLKGEHLGQAATFKTWEYL